MNLQNPLWTGLARYGSDRDSIAIELVKACEEVSKLKQQLTKSRQRLKKLQAKRDHHLRERDRYRDLYAEAQKRIQELSAKTPGF